MTVDQEAQLSFFNSASAADTQITNSGASVSNSLMSGSILFENTSTASTAMITNDGGTAENAAGGSTSFNGASADHATIINNGGALNTSGQQPPPGQLPIGAQGGVTTFVGSASAGNANISKLLLVLLPVIKGRDDLVH